MSTLFYDRAALPVRTAQNFAPMEGLAMHKSSVAIGVLAVVVAAAGIEINHPALAQGWNQCCGMSPWPMGHGMMGSMPRHHQAMMSGVPAPYYSLRNPLPRTRKTVERGPAVYDQSCASCHGATGEGDGAAGQNLSRPPANLALLSQMPMAQWDPFLYWTVAEGGAQFGTAMPAFKDALSSEDIWAVIAYIQARLPPKPK
jgi:mono/diheme cytochrome c family protein